jgi:predicted metal-dependent RNase
MQIQILRKKKNPFIDPRLKGIGSGAERREVMHSVHPCIVLATSGMLQGGPAMEYLKEFAANPANCLLFVGYQAEGTLGRRIQKGWRHIPIEGNEHGLELKLQVDTIEGLSGHSDLNQLINWIRNLKAKPRKIICNHGESSVISSFVRTLHNELHVETVAPKNLETIRLK